MAIKFGQGNVTPIFVRSLTHYFFETEVVLLGLVTGSKPLYVLGMYKHENENRKGTTWYVTQLESENIYMYINNI